MNKIFYFLMVFFAFSAVQVGAQQDGKGTADAPGFKVDGANMMGDAICPEGGCDSARGTEKARDMKGDLDMTGSNAPAPQDHKVGQERFDPMMGGKGTPTIHDDEIKGMKAPHQSPR